MDGDYCDDIRASQLAQFGYGSDAVVIGKSVGPSYTFGAERWPGLGKVVEEMGEALAELGKLLGTGGVETHSTGADLRQAIKEEASDVLAAWTWFFEHNFSHAEMVEIWLRVNQKLGLYDTWRKENT